MTEVQAASWLEDFSTYLMVMGSFSQLVGAEVPSDGKVRDYLSDERAEALFLQACER
jgi:hypothetical protein